MMIHEAQFCISAKSLLRPFITFLFHDLYTFRMPVFSFGLSELYTPLWFGVLFCSEGSSTVIVSLQVPGRNHLLLFTLADTVSLPLIFLCGPSAKESICQCRRHKRHGFDPGLERSSGVGNDNPLQHSCLENPMDRGAWWATVHGAAKNQTWLKRLSIYRIVKNGIGCNLSVIKSCTVIT